MEIVQTSDNQTICKTVLGDSTQVESHPAVEIAINLRRTVRLPDDFAAKDGDKVNLVNLFPVICAPIIVRDKPKMVLFASRQESSLLFGEEEERLAQFIAAIAGAALENTELLESIKTHTEQLAQSNLELEQFAYIASHDLQEPLRMVASFCQLLDREFSDKLGEEGKKWTQFAIEGAKRMQTLINDLLLYSRIQSKPQSLSLVSCQDVLQEVIQNLRATIDSSAALITFDRLPTVSADRSQFIQLFQNLIGNAIKFRGDKAPEVKISARMESDEWIFSVSDNGIGIDRENHERVFDIFRRLHTRESYPGTGIGLAVCRRVVLRHGGRIWLDSELGKGSTFYFSFPRFPKSEVKDELEKSDGS